MTSHFPTVRIRAGLLACAAMVAMPGTARAQVDQQRAQAYFEEAAALCQQEGGRLWGVSLCGPMVIADAATQSMATNQPAPPGPRPPTLGFVNAPVEWGGTQWSAYLWMLISPDDPVARGRLFIHELHHRVQRQLGQLLVGKPNDHLEDPDGRYWLLLEWRALARALESSGTARSAAVSDALAFRETRRGLFAGAAESERADEIREGLAQYTGTVVASRSPEAAAKDALRQLSEAERAPTFVRTFGYPSGTAYGLLLDTWSPGWTRTMKPGEDLGQLLASAAKLQPAADVAAAARRYGAPALRVAEDKREAERAARVAELRRRFVDGPVLIVPRGRGAVTNTTGVTPISGEGTVFFEYRVTAEWGRLESRGILESVDGVTLRLEAPFRTEGDTLTGALWTIVLTPGWSVRPGNRSGDFRIVRDSQ